MEDLSKLQVNKDTSFSYEFVYYSIGLKFGKLLVVLLTESV